MQQRARLFLEHLARTQAAYESRDLDAYLAGFAPDYCCVQLGETWSEDKARLARKIGGDIGHFDVVAMNFKVLQHWFAGSVGFARIEYHTRLRARATGRIVDDRRHNLIVAEEKDDKSWSIISKFVLEVLSDQDCSCDEPRACAHHC